MSVLCSYYEESISDNCIIGEVDKKILDLLESHETEYFDGVIPEDSSWEVFMNLSRMRNSLLNWYPFREGSHILEVGSGYGALTGILCDRGVKVTAVESSMIRARILNKRYFKRSNLEIHVGTIESLIIEEKFDYIVIPDVVKRKDSDLIDKLRRLFALLKPDGKVLIAAENRYGLKYFCGGTDEYIKTPFEGINKYPNGSDTYLLSRQELIDYVSAAGFKQYKFYYPMPDFKLTQAVYTDEYMPKGSIRDRIISYCRETENLVAVEDRIYDDLIHNNVLHFFSNSFLLECSESGNSEKPIYAALSTDREAAHAFATIIQDDDIVIKRALYPEGIKTLKNIYDNLKDLEMHGISIVPVKMNESCLEMPYIKQKNLADLLSEMIHRDKKQFEDTIEFLYQDIIRSSEHVSVTACSLNMKRIPQEEAGVILKTAYIDMIPYNCFYCDGRFTFYDQEFKRENLPAKYILFRILRYMYFYIPDAEELIPLQYFKEKYLLMRLWGIFEREEADFVEVNRDCSSLKQFYKWAKIDKEEIYSKSTQTLRKSVEQEFDYENDEALKELKRVQLDILKYFQNFCEKHDLRYCAIYGSLLGTVRHHGFIPWDDDIDLAMPREDYERLKTLSADFMEKPYFFQFPENDPECFYGGYGKLRNSNTAGLEDFNAGHKCNQGIWIDVFPLDVCYADEEKRKKHIEKINFVQQLLWYKIYPERKYILKDLSKGKVRIIKILSAIMSHRKLCNWLENTILDCQENSDKLAILSRYLKPDQMAVFDKADFMHSFEMPFEDTVMPVPIGYKHWLYENVGADYRIYPKPRQRVPHHHAKFDANRPYTEMI